jgi:hypothetical protein
MAPVETDMTIDCLDEVQGSVMRFCLQRFAVAGQHVFDVEILRF